MGVSTMGIPLPDLVIQKIIQILPTKAAVRMSSLSKQWEGLWCSGSVLDFEEDGDESLDHCDKLGDDQHRKFINILKKYLECCGINDKQKKQIKLDKLRLHMKGYISREDATLVDKLLSCSFQRNVKQLDLSLRFRTDWFQKENYYCLSRNTFLDAKSITSLSLQNVIIKDIIDSDHEPKHDHIRLLPFLKTMSLKTAHFAVRALPFLIRECPYMEYLSLTSCSFEHDHEDEYAALYVSSSSLKFLQVKHCNARDIEVNETMNLESFTFVSSETLLVESLKLRNSYNLRHINIHAPHLNSLLLYQAHDTLKATINAPNLNNCDFIGYLKSKISLKAPKLDEATILPWDFWNKEPIAFDGPRKHLQILADFLKQFGLSKNVNLIVPDSKVLFFPKEFRNICSSPLAGLNENLVVAASAYAPRTEADDSAVGDSLIWIAPFAQAFIRKPIFGSYVIGELELKGITEEFLPSLMY